MKYLAVFTLIYALIINILLASKIIDKWPNLYTKTWIHKSADFFKNLWIKKQHKFKICLA